MATQIRIKRRAAGGTAGAPTTLLNGELAFNEQDDTLYYGKGAGVGGLATNVIAIAGPGKYPNVGTANTYTGTQTFNGGAVFGGTINFGSGTITNLPLDKLTDVTIATPTNGQILTYDNASSQWKNSTPNTADVRSLLDTDVTAATGATTSAKITAALINKALITGVADLASGDITVVSGTTVGTSGSYIYDGSAWVVLPSGGGGGTVTSVSLTVPPWLSVSGSPVTTNGTLAITSAAEAANVVLAGPATGANAVPSFRPLVAADIPALPAYALSTRTVTVEDGLTIGNTTAPTGTNSTLNGNLFIGVGVLDCGTF